MDTSFDTATTALLATIIVTAFLAFFVPPLLSYLRVARRSAARRAPHYLNLCGSTARHNIRRTTIKQAA